MSQDEDGQPFEEKDDERVNQLVIEGVNCMENGAKNRSDGELVDLCDQEQESCKNEAQRLNSRL